MVRLRLALGGGAERRVCIVGFEELKVDGDEVCGFEDGEREG